MSVLRSTDMSNLLASVDDRPMNSSTGKQVVPKLLLIYRKVLQFYRIPIPLSLTDWPSTNISNTILYRALTRDRPLPVNEFAEL